MIDSVRQTAGRGLFLVLVATTLATQARVPALGLGLAELAGAGLLVLEASNIVRRLRTDLLLAMTAVVLGFLVGYTNNLMLGLSVNTTVRDLFALIYAMLAGLAAASHLAREERPVVTVALALSAGLLVQLLPLGLTVVGVDGAFWLGEDDEPGLPFLSRYTGFSTNPNQLGVMVCSFPFVAVEAWLQSRESSTRWVVGAGLAACGVIAVLIQSNTVFASYMVTAAIVLMLAWNRPHQGRVVPGRVLASAALLLVVAAGFLVYADASIEKTGDRDANGRFSRWNTALDGIAQTGLLGAGPGGQSGELRPFDGTEAHNTLLDVTLQGGVLAVIAYLVVVMLAWRAAQRSGRPLLLGMLLSTLIQQATHYTLRHPISWIYLLLPLVVVMQFRPAPGRPVAVPAPAAPPLHPVESGQAPADAR
jgi:O-antigen ligase